MKQIKSKWQNKNKLPTIDGIYERLDPYIKKQIWTTRFYQGNWYYIHSLNSSINIHNLATFDKKWRGLIDVV